MAPKWSDSSGRTITSNLVWRIESKFSSPSNVKISEKLYKWLSEQIIISKNTNQPIIIGDDFNQTIRRKDHLQYRNETLNQCQTSI